MATEQFNLIPIQTSTLNDEIVQTVNARELHAFLESKRQFSSWITYQIEAFGFTQDVDFITINNSEYSPPRKDYHITIDMAKELSMVERSAKGKQARKYFIEVEKAYRQQVDAPQFKIPKTLSEALQLAADQARQIEQQTQQIEVMTPKADYYDQIMGSEDLLDGEQAAKVLRMPRRGLYEFLRSYGVLTKSNMPMQLYIDRDYMRVKQTPYKDMLGTAKVSLKVVFTQKGLLYIQGMLRNIMIDPKALAVLDA